MSVWFNEWTSTFFPNLSQFYHHNGPGWPTVQWLILMTLMQRCQQCQMAGALWPTVQCHCQLCPGKKNDLQEQDIIWLTYWQWWTPLDTGHIGHQDLVNVECSESDDDDDALLLTSELMTKPLWYKVNLLEHIGKWMQKHCKCKIS